MGEDKSKEKQYREEFNKLICTDTSMIFSNTSEAISSAQRCYLAGRRIFEAEFSKAQADLKLAVDVLINIKHKDTQLGFCLCPDCLEINRVLKQIKNGES